MNQNQNKYNVNQNQTGQANQGQLQQMAQQPRIAAKFQFGAVKATVWENEDKSGKSYNTVSLNRVYKDAVTGEWKHTESMRNNDLPKAILALTKAYEIINSRNENIDE